MRKICVVVGSRANYSSIKSVMRSIKAHPDLELQVVAGASAILDRYGSASEIMRLAMIRLVKRFKSLKNVKSKILLQIHDELIFEMPNAEIKEICNVVKEEMISVAKSDLHAFSIPLTVDINSGDNWGILH